MTNILIEYLKALGVPYTKSYSIKEYSSGAFHNSLFGLSRLLSKYNVKNSIVRFNSKKFSDKTLPLLIYFKKKFIVIKAKNGNLFEAVDSAGICFNLDESVLSNDWEGYAIIASRLPTSTEYNFLQHKKIQNWDYCCRTMICIGLLLCISYLFYFNHKLLTEGTIIIIVINLIGLLAASMSLMNYLSIPNISNKLCDVIKASKTKMKRRYASLFFLSINVRIIFLT